MLFYMFSYSKTRILIEFVNIYIFLQLEFQIGISNM